MQEVSFVLCVEKSVLHICGQAYRWNTRTSHDQAIQRLTGIKMLLTFLTIEGRGVFTEAIVRIGDEIHRLEHHQETIPESKAAHP